MKTTREKLLKWLHTKDGWRWLQENYYPESVKPTMKTTREQAKKEFSNKKGRAYIPKNESELYWSLVEFGYPHPEAIEISRKYHKFIEHLLEKERERLLRWRKDNLKGWVCPHGVYISYKGYKDGESCEKYHPKFKVKK